MKVGVFYFPADYGINVAELAKALEDRGFDSLFVPEHTHIPLSRKSPVPGGGGPKPGAASRNLPVRAAKSLCLTRRHYYLFDN